MRILYDLIPSEAETAVALGFFDGVHRGHRAVLSDAVACKKDGLVPAAFTFRHTPKPRDRNMQLLTFERKIELLEDIGIELLYVIDFDKVRRKSPEQFVREILSGVFNARRVFCGFNYRFGVSGGGNTDDLVRLCRAENILATVCAPVTVDGMLASSTEIRGLLRDGDVRRANRLLGYEFGIRGVTVEGNHLGSAMETPTVNLMIPHELVLPRFGVYASRVSFDGKSYIGVTNIGVKPTVGDSNAPNCETWMPEYEGGKLYGKEVEVRLVGFIRPEKRFESLTELEKAIKNDGGLALRMMKNEYKTNKNNQ